MLSSLGDGLVEASSDLTGPAKHFDNSAKLIGEDVSLRADLKFPPGLLLQNVLPT